MGHFSTISVLTPVYNTDPEVLRACIESVIAQTYPHWELCLVDDRSPDPRVWPLLQEFAASDSRIRILRSETNGGIVAASNAAADLATGEVIALLDHDDLLTPQALERVAAAFAPSDTSDPEKDLEDGNESTVDYVYSDEDILDIEGRRVSPFFKPDWSPERFRTQMYTCHLSAIRRELFDKVGGFREGFDGSQDWDLVLRVTEAARKIVHIPEVLYHWRTVPASVLSGEHAKPYAYDAALKALRDHCRRVGIDGEVEELAARGHFRVRRTPITGLVSIVIPTCGNSGQTWGYERVMVVEAIRSVVDRSTYPDVEIIVVADTSTPSSVLDSLSEIAGERLRIIEWDKPFDFSAKCNLGAVHAHGEYLIFLNDDTEVITPDWIETLGGFLKEPDVGATGALLLFEDGRLQHAGHVHLNGGPGHLMFGWLPTNTRNRNALALDREVAGVTAACLMTRTETFFEVGGFSPQFPNNYNDVDLCLKLRAAGYRVIVSPHARLFHFESVSRDPSIAPSETAMLDRRWHQQLRRDPYYNPNHVAGLDSFSVPIVYPPMTR